MPILRMPSFPTIVSNKIEMPDIAELLLYPMFHRAEGETIRKYATEFQKKLLDMCPLRNNTKHVIVFSNVQVLDPMRRLFTNSIPAEQGREWHVDGLGEYGGLWSPNDTVHFLLGHVKETTEFCKNPMSFDIPKEWGRPQFNSYINTDPIYETIVPQAIELGKIYTFTNHIHRAVPTKGISFRYTFRVRETDRDEPFTIEQQMPKVGYVNDIMLQNKVKSIGIGNDHIKVYVPSSFNGFRGG